jgi:hypothetical protein
MARRPGAHRTRRLLAIAVVFTAGCESGGAFPPSDLAFEEFCPRWQARVGELNQRCNDIPLATADTGVCARQAEDLAAHRLGYDRSRATSCLRFFDNVSCATFRQLTTYLCDGTAEPQVAAGGACTGAGQCADDRDHHKYFCDQPAPGLCPGVCRPRIALGADCSAAPRGCVTSAGCFDTAGGRRCVMGIDRGGACDPAMSACYSDTVCAATSAGAAPACLVPLYPGDACWGPGAPCPWFAICGAAGMCVRRPVLDEPCGQLGERYVYCLSGWCDGAAGGPAGVCRAPLPVGAACDQDTQCAGADTVCIDHLCAVATCTGA